MKILNRIKCNNCSSNFNSPLKVMSIPGGGGVRGGGAGKSEKLPCPGVKFPQTVPCPLVPTDKIVSCTGNL